MKNRLPKFLEPKFGPLFAPLRVTATKRMIDFKGFMVVVGVVLVWSNDKKPTSHCLVWNKSFNAK